MDDLFANVRENARKKAAPLAARMRPATLDEYVGQDHIIGPGKLLRRAIEADRLTSVIFYGPPGTGKTTLAQLISKNTQSDFKQLSAVTAGVADIREIIKNAKENVELYGRKTVLFIDEIHRFNKGQQDALLPAVEEGLVVLVGATTENPYFEVNAALLSRSRVFKLESLTVEDIKQIMSNALNNVEKGLGDYRVQLTEQALDHIAEMSAGDARIALNALELAVMTTAPDASGVRQIDLAVAEESIQRSAVVYDKDGDYHYDIISAFIKSMRGCAPDAAIYWLARMIDAGESPEFVMRRVLICAAEDVGLADPQALQVAVAAMQAAHFVGWPEAQIPVAMAVLYVANAPKSNSANAAIESALQEVRGHKPVPVPIHLRNPVTKGAKEMGYGRDYHYGHAFAGHFVQQDYLPPEYRDRKFYEPSEEGLEKAMKERLTAWWQTEQEE